MTTNSGGTTYTVNVNLTTIRGQDICKAVSDAGVGIVYGTDALVAPWVKQAIQLYRKNHGFADMSLTQWLIKLKQNREIGDKDGETS